MHYTFPITEEMVCARSTLPISKIHAHVICKAINRKNFMRARDLVRDLSEEKRSLDGRYYTKTAKHLLFMLNGLEANARAKNADAEKMKLYISVHQGPALYRARRKSSFGRKMKICHVQAVLKGEKTGTREKVRSSIDKKSTG